MSSLIGVVGFSEKLRPKITFSFWEFIKKFTFTLFNFMAFSNSPETEENPTRISDELIWELLPVIEISEESAIARAGSRDIPGSCAVCLCEYLGGEEIRCLRSCEHVFHRRCLDSWMNRDRWTCPLCRTPIIPSHLLPELDRRLGDTSIFVAAD